MTVYFIQRPDKTIKIGKCTDFNDRKGALRKQYGEFEVLGIMDGDLDYEKSLHLRFAHLNTGKDGREWFHQSDELDSFIKANCVPAPTPRTRREPTGRKMSARIVCTPETHKKIQGYAYGLGANFDEALNFLLDKVIGDLPSWEAGDRDRHEFWDKQKQPD